MIMNINYRLSHDVYAIYMLLTIGFSGLECRYWVL